MAGSHYIKFCVCLRFIAHGKVHKSLKRKPTNEFNEWKVGYLLHTKLCVYVSQIAGPKYAHSKILLTIKNIITITIIKGYDTTPYIKILNHCDPFKYLTFYL